MVIKSISLFSSKNKVVSVDSVNAEKVVFQKIAVISFIFLAYVVRDFKLAGMLTLCVLGVCVTAREPYQSTM